MAKKVDFMTGFNQATQNLPASAFSEQERIKKNLIIVNELQRFIPALAADEYKQLENNILQHGCKDPLTIWETTEQILGISTTQNNIYVILDGHNRYEICKNNQLDFKISTPLKFDSINDAKEYMINHQLGRRNLNPEQVSYFRGLKYLSLKKEKGKYEREDHTGKIYHYENEGENSSENHTGKTYHYENEGENSSENHTGKIYHYAKTTTAQELAKEFNISEKTIRNDALFAKSVENLPLEIRNKVLQGKSEFTKSEIIELGKEKNKGEELEVLNKKSLKVISVKDKILNVLKRQVLEVTKEDCEELIKELRKMAKLKN